MLTQPSRRLAAEPRWSRSGRRRASERALRRCSGTTAVVRADLTVPAARSRTLTGAVLSSPGERPLDELVGALERPGLAQRRVRIRAPGPPQALGSGRIVPQGDDGIVELVRGVDRDDDAAPRALDLARGRARG